MASVNSQQENPTPVRIGNKLSAAFEQIGERAYTSPSWYTP
jgi:hypothetical protein